jgi:hypothetical protein
MTVHMLRAASRPGGPLVDFLTDPGGFWAKVSGGGISWLGAHAPVLAPCTGVAVASGYALRHRLRLWRERHLADGARCVEILAPPTVAPRGGEVLWAQLAGLLRPW